MTKTELLARLREQGKKLQGVAILDSYEVLGREVHQYQKSHVDATKVFKQCISEISKIRGLWKVEPKYVRFIDNTVVLDELKLVAKPCKEFERLNSYLVKYCKLSPLEYDKVVHQDIDGKRSNIWVNHESLLCHKAERCKQLLNILRESKASSYKCKIQFKDRTYYGDRFNSYGEDMEIEWQGWQDRYALITLITKTGKEAKKIELSVY